MLKGVLKGFDFKVETSVDGWKCGGCKVYAAGVYVPSLDLALCRFCLDRLRLTLKEALGALPEIPKRPRPCP